MLELKQNKKQNKSLVSQINLAMELLCISTFLRGTIINSELFMQEKIGNHVKLNMS